MVLCADVGRVGPSPGTDVGSRSERRRSICSRVLARLSGYVQTIATAEEATPQARSTKGLVLWSAAQLSEGTDESE
jgi:hypothetical protein